MTLSRFWNYENDHEATIRNGRMLLSRGLREILSDTMLYVSLGNESPNYPFVVICDARSLELPAHVLRRKRANQVVVEDDHLILDDVYLNHAGITKQALCIGMAEWFELWNPKTWGRYKAAAGSFERRLERLWS